MNIQSGQIYRNELGAVLTITKHVALTNIRAIGEIWVGETQDKIFGPREYLVTVQGLEGAGYTLTEGVTK